MYAKLKEFSSTDINFNDYYPLNDQKFGFWATLLIGPESEDCSELFQLLICTPDWLKSENMEKNPIWSRHMLIVFEYDLRTIKAVIERYVNNCSGKNWGEIDFKLSRVTKWEFEDYQIAIRE